MKNNLWNSLSQTEMDMVDELRNEHLEDCKLNTFDQDQAMEYLSEFHHTAIESEEAFIILLSALERDDFDLNDEHTRNEFREILNLVSLNNDTIMHMMEQNSLATMMADTFIQEIIDNKPKRTPFVETPQKRD